MYTCKLDSPLCKVVSREDNPIGQTAFTKWLLDESLPEAPSISDRLLKSLTKKQTSSLSLDCVGCELDSPNCSCILNTVSFENKFSIYVLLEISHLEMTKWCPITEIGGKADPCQWTDWSSCDFFCNTTRVTRRTRKRAEKDSNGQCRQELDVRVPISTEEEKCDPNHQCTGEQTAIHK